jgi:hypothetical protein
VPPEAVQVILDVGRENIYLSLVPDDYEPRPLLPLDPTTQVLPGESDGTLTPYDGYDGVVNPGESADELVFSDEDGRIGSTPSAGGTSDEDTDDSVTTSGGSTDSRQPTTTAPPEGDGEDGEDGDGDTTTTTEAEGL